MIDIVRRAVVDEYRPQPQQQQQQGFTFSRNSLAYDDYGRLYYPHQLRYVLVDGRMGVLVEEGTTNLLTANQSSFETDLTGFVSNPSYSTSRDTSTAWHGGACVKISGTASGANWLGYVYAHVTAGLTYTASVYVKGSGNGRFRLEFYNAAQQWLAMHFVDFTASESWTRVSLTATAPENATTTRLVLYTPVAQTFTFYADGFQLEPRAYPTSWTLGGTTRAAETLTVPTAGVLYPQEGTVEAWVYVPSVSFGRAPVLLDVRDSTALNRLYFELSVDKRPTAAINKNATPYVARGPTPLSPGWHFVAITWSKMRLACYADGALVATYSNPPLLDDIARVALGSTTTNAYHFNSFVGPIRISRRARTDQEIADAYAAGTLTADADTTLLLDFSKGPYVRRAAKVIRAV